jgi:hypothetical protein
LKICAANGLNKKPYRAKTPSTQRKKFIDPNLGALCAFARDMFFRHLLHPKVSSTFD